MYLERAYCCRLTQTYAKHMLVVAGEKSSSSSAPSEVVEGEVSSSLPARSSAGVEWSVSEVLLEVVWIVTSSLDDWVWVEGSSGSKAHLFEELEMVGWDGSGFALGSVIDGWVGKSSLSMASMKICKKSTDRKSISEQWVESMWILIVPSNLVSLSQCFCVLSSHLCLFDLFVESNLCLFHFSGTLSEQFGRGRRYRTTDW